MRHPKETETDSLTYVLGLIGLIGALVFEIIPPLFTNNVNNETKWMLQLAVSILYVTLITLFLYILTRGYALSTLINNDLKRKLIKTSSELYEATFLLFYFSIYLLLTSYGFTVLLFGSKESVTKGIIGLLLVISILLIYSTLRILKMKHSKEIEEKLLKAKKIILEDYFVVTLIFLLVLLLLGIYTSKTVEFHQIIATILLISSFLPFTIDFTSYTKKIWNNHQSRNAFIFLILLMVASTSLYTVPLNDIEIEMDNIHKLSTNQVSAKVKIDGIDSILAVYLFKNNDNLEFNQIDHIIFDYKVPYTTNESKYLLGTYLSNGEYELYINTTEMDPGYYGLLVKVLDKDEHRTFYLVNT